MSQLFVDDVVSKEGTNSVGFSKGISVSVASTFSGDVSIGGTLTYEDVTNIDSVGLITARSGIKFGAAGVGGTIRANGDTTLAGVVTATSFVGDGSALTGMANTANVNTSSLNVIGIATVGAGLSFADDIKAKFGAGGDLSIYHNGSTNIIDAATSNAISFRRGGSEQFFIGNAEFKGGDDKKIKLGTGDDFQFFHSSNENFIRCNATASPLYIDCTENLHIRHLDTNGSNSETMIKAVGDGAVEIYYDNSKKFESTSSGTITTGISTVTVGTDLDGYKVEEGSYDTNALNGEFDFELENGHVQTHTGSTAGTYFPDFRVSSSQSLSSVMDVGDVISATLIVTASNASHYCTSGIKIDNSTSNVTVEWIGSSAPSAGKGAGYDIYSFTIQKTAATPAYLVIVNATDAG